MRTTPNCKCGRPAVDEYRNPNDGSAWTPGCSDWPFCEVHALSECHRRDMAQRIEAARKKAN